MHRVIGLSWCFYISNTSHFSSQAAQRIITNIKAPGMNLTIENDFKIISPFCHEIILEKILFISPYPGLIKATPNSFSAWSYQHRILFQALQVKQKQTTVFFFFMEHILLFPIINAQFFNHCFLAGFHDTHSSRHSRACL